MVIPAVGTETATFVVRRAGAGSSAFLADVRAAITSVNPNLSPATVRTLAALQADSTARTSMMLSLLAIAGVMALALGLMGVSGVVSYAVSQRRSEIGLRLALGARVGDVRGMFVRQALVLVVIGVVVGLAAAAVLTRLMASQLYGVTPLDPATHVGVAMTLAAAAVAASYLSARRGTSLDPVAVLRAD
jgi:ABC-type antimicrobial peptide transport system permease subunit